MNKFYNEMLYKLETTINKLEIETDCPIQNLDITAIIIIYI